MNNHKYIILFLLVQFSFHAMVYADTISVYFNSAVPQHEFAANDIKAALEDDGYIVAFKDLTSLDTSSLDKKIVIALSDNSKVANLLSDREVIVPDDLEGQAYALITTAPGLSYWVIGGDNNGAMYGALQMAEYIQFDGFSRSYNEQEAPELKHRGIKFNIPFDHRSSTYLRLNSGTSHKHAIRNVWDINFWKTWFDEMARHRYNVLSLWSSHPFTSMVNMEDEYPGVAIQNVEGYDEIGLPKFTKIMSIDEKVQFWQEVMRYGADRGFDMYMVTWNIYVYGAEGKHGITDDISNQNTREYLQKCVVKFLETYPNITGIGVTAGENLDGTNDEKEEWLWDTYGEGIMEYAQATPLRKLVFIHRIHTTDWEVMDKYFAPLISLPNVKYDLSHKYSLAHMHGAIKPDFKNLYGGVLPYLRSNNLETWLNLRNDDFFFLHWADPTFARNYINNFPDEVTGFYIGADGWTFSRVFTAKDPYYRDQNALSIQKTWYMQKLWGRIAYSPDVSDEILKKHLAFRYPEVNSNTLFDAWSKASAAMVLANEQVTDSWRRDATWYPEMWSYSVDGGGHYTLEDTKLATPMPGSELCNLAATASNNCGGKISAWENADEIEQLAREAKQLLESLTYGSNIDLKYNLHDIQSLANLSLYCANKYRAAMFSLAGNQLQARDAMAKAYCHWLQYTIAMDEMYMGVDLQRNEGFSDWHAYDNVVLQDYLNLGGDPYISCGEVPLIGIQIEICPSNLYSGTSYQLSADFSPSYASNKNVSWSSSDTSVATVDDTGLVSALDTGSVIITLIADDGGYSDQCAITVKESPGCLLPWTDDDVSISGGTVNYHSDVIDISCATSVKISFDIETTSGSLESDQDYLFFSFRVDGGTLLREVERWGNVNLEHIEIPDVSGATLEMFIEGYTSAGSEVYQVSNISVEDASDLNVSVTGVTMLDCPSGTLTEGAIHQLGATIIPANADDLALIWTSLNDSVATVDSSGLVITVSAGETTIYVSTEDGSFSDECKMVVNDDLNTISNALSSEMIKIYPNPAKDRLYLEFSDNKEQHKIRVFDNSGKQIYETKTAQTVCIIDLEEQRMDGLLSIYVCSGNDVSAFKIIINR